MHGQWEEPNYSISLYFVDSWTSGRGLNWSMGGYLTPIQTQHGPASSPWKGNFSLIQTKHGPATDLIIIHDKRLHDEYHPNVPNIVTGFTYVLWSFVFNSPSESVNMYPLVAV